MYNFKKSTGLSYYIGNRKDVDKEVISSTFALYEKNKKEYTIYQNKNQDLKKIGSLLFEFIYADFNIFENFITFFNNYMDGFISYFDKDVMNYFSSNITIKEADYKNTVKKVYDTALLDITNLQAKVKDVLEFCLEKSTDIRLINLSPFYRLNILKSNSKPEDKYLFLYDTQELDIYHLASVYTLKGMQSRWLKGPAPNGDICPQIAYHSRDIRYVLPIMLNFLLHHKIPISKCETCGRYFLADSKKAKYCNYPSLDNPTKLCSVFSRETSYKAKVEKNPLEKEYRKVYQRLEDLSSKNKGKTSCKTTFEKFKIEGKAKKQDWKNGILSDVEFEIWLSRQI